MKKCCKMLAEKKPAALMLAILVGIGMTCLVGKVIAKVEKQKRYEQCHCEWHYIDAVRHDNCEACEWREACENCIHREVCEYRYG